MRFRMLLIFISTLLVVNGAAAENKNTNPDNDKRYQDVADQIKLFGEVYREVNKRYVEDIDPTDFIKAGINGMLGTLDPYTVYFEPDQTEDLQIMTQGEYGGIGVEIGLRGKKKELTIISPIEDTPASRIRLQAGDVIIAVDGISTEGFTTSDAAKYIRGPEGTEVTLTIRRDGFKESLEYTLTRENIRMHDIMYSGMIDDGIGYVKMVRFSGRAAEELIEALKDVMDQDPKGLILDLRSNPGGLLPSAVMTAQQFLQTGDQIVSTRGRFNSTTREFKSRRKPMAGDVPLVVMVNGGSASASEIVAGAIQDLDRGIIIGTPTFGKGLVQSVINLSNGSALKITTARYYTPSGRLIQRDRSFFEDENYGLIEDNGEDTALNEADEVGIDSLAEKYTTRNGRTVFGGGGITPDLVVEFRKMSDIEIEMHRRDLFFSFIRNWINHYGQPDTVDITSEMIAEFYSFVDSIGFENPVPGNNEITLLKELGKDNSLEAGYFALVDSLEAILSRKIDLRDPDLRELIYQNLDREMATTIEGRNGRIRSSFDEDNQIAEAIRILKDPDLYASILQAPTRAEADPNKP